MQMVQAKYKVSIAALLLGGCGFFGSDSDDDDAPSSDESAELGGTEEGGELPPTEGFRVFPQFMLQDVAAIVTIEAGGGQPAPCALDDAPEGGYVCDAEGLPGATATIRVNKDGFDGAVRNPPIASFQIVPLEVHLSGEGGPTGSWSGCAAVGEFASCAELCAAEDGVCAVTACATGQDEWPVATFEGSIGPDCAEPLEWVAASCEAPLPLAGLESLRCCCS